MARFKPAFFPPPGPDDRIVRITLTPGRVIPPVIEDIPQLTDLSQNVTLELA